MPKTPPDMGCRIGRGILFLYGFNTLLLAVFLEKKIGRKYPVACSEVVHSAGNVPSTMAVWVFGGCSGVSALWVQISRCLLRCKFGILFLGAGYFGFFTGKNLLFRPNLIFVPKSANQNYYYYFNNHCESRIFADKYQIFYNKRKIEILTFEKI